MFKVNNKNNRKTSLTYSRMRLSCKFTKKKSFFTNVFQRDCLDFESIYFCNYPLLVVSFKLDKKSRIKELSKFCKKNISGHPGIKYIHRPGAVFCG